jgi:hypothetical protein
MSSNATPVRTEDQEWRYASAALSWYGWGSPIGAGVFLLCIAGVVALLRYAFFG